MVSHSKSFSLWVYMGLNLGLYLVVYKHVYVYSREFIWPCADFVRLLTWKKKWTASTFFQFISLEVSKLPNSAGEPILQQYLI